MFLSEIPDVLQKLIIEYLHKFIEDHQDLLKIGFRHLTFKINKTIEGKSKMFLHNFCRISSYRKFIVDHKNVRGNISLIHGNIKNVLRIRNGKTIKKVYYNGKLFSTEKNGIRSLISKDENHVEYNFKNLNVKIFEKEDEDRVNISIRDRNINKHIRIHYMKRRNKVIILLQDGELRYYSLNEFMWINDLDIRFYKMDHSIKRIGSKRF